MDEQYETNDAKVCDISEEVPVEEVALQPRTLNFEEVRLIGGGWLELAL